MKINLKARALFALIGISLVLIGAWFSGFNFNQRGCTAVFVYLASLAVGIVGIACPLADD